MLTLVVVRNYLLVIDLYISSPQGSRITKAKKYISRRAWYLSRVFFFSESVSAKMIDIEGNKEFLLYIMFHLLQQICDMIIDQEESR